jgi:hypothetical protein
MNMRISIVSRSRIDSIRNVIGVSKIDTKQTHKHETQKSKNDLLRDHRAGAGEGTRTLNLRITNPMLYQLSYASQ